MRMHTTPFLQCRPQSKPELQPWLFVSVSVNSWRKGLRMWWRSITIPSPGSRESHPSRLNFPFRSVSCPVLRLSRRKMVADPSSVRVYTVNGPAAGASSSLPDWLIRKRASKGKREQREYVEGTLELIQHFEFPEASNKIRTTRDGHHAIATGTYKPQMRVWDLDQLSLKFERHSDAENVDFLVSELLFASAP